jgi:hypothetical protein
MSWREICRVWSASGANKPKFGGTAEHALWCRDASKRIFGGAPLPGVTPFGVSKGIGKLNRKLMSSKDKEGLINRLQWPYVRPELLSGRMYREREKLAAKVQAGIKGAQAGAVAAEKEAKLKKKK